MKSGATFFWTTTNVFAFGAAQVDAWRTAQRAHAIANGVFVVAVNRVGHEGLTAPNGIDFWGVVACVVAMYAASLGSLIEVVNKFGSFFYGSILGVFILAMIPRARAIG